VLIGPTFAPEAFKPDIKKFNPVSNIKAKFKFKTLFELIKQLFKIIGAVFLIYGVMKNSAGDLIHTLNMPLPAAFSIYISFLLQVILRVGLFFVAVALADLIYQRKNFAKEMMMEKHEVKQEYKNSEGDPQIKGKRKQLAQEMAYSSGPAAGVKEGKAVITNPTHLAIAIAYEPEEYPLPYICALGQDSVAHMIVLEAKKHDIPVLRNIALAHKLYEEGDVWDFIPDASYEAVAEILRWVKSLDPANEDNNNDDKEKE
ncbi:MAG: EscU/YscU/HrcU family type III secretion system export apparatus switch protein, partial [Waddliaceae bacterium]|nr:EscU/YscU/HrcU family type III secretion system export apparatus switch protein [Waddliaceae bacterium]